MSEPIDDDPAPWYDPGLNFTCTGCGDCCTGEAGVVWVDDDEVAAIAGHAGLTEAEVRLFHARLIGRRTSLREKPNGDCTFLDGPTRRCAIYPVRPVQCRTWPFWDSNLRSPAAWEQTCRECPGAGAGAFVPAAEVRRRAAERAM